MLLLIQQCRAVMLAVDVQKLRADPAQLGHGDGPAVGTAVVLAVGRQFPLEQQFAVFIWCNAALRKALQ